MRLNPSMFVPVTFALLLILAPQLAVGQESGGTSGFPVLEGPYLGQEPPGMEPRLFAPGIISHPAYRTYTYVFLPGGNEFVFDYYGDTEYRKGAIFTTRVEDGKWIEPEPSGLLAPFGEVFLPRVSPDGENWFFTSRSLPLPDGVEGDNPLFYIRETRSGWSEPRYLAQGIHASATLAGRVYYVVEGRDTGYPGFWEPGVDGYSRLVFCEPKTYFGGDMAHLVVAPDESYMIFDSESRPRIGECRLHISFRKPDGNWTMPMSMGGLIEMKASMPWITPDAKYIFFRANDDVYWVDAGIVEKMRPKGIKTGKK
jgi:hypothetical protein